MVITNFKRCQIVFCTVLLTAFSQLDVANGEKDRLKHSIQQQEVKLHEKNEMQIKEFKKQMVENDIQKQLVDANEMLKKSEKETTDLKVQLLEANAKIVSLKKKSKSAFDVITNLRSSGQNWEIKLAKISKEYLSDAIKFANEAIQSHTEYGAISRFIAKKFGEKYGGYWNCIVGIDAYFRSLVSGKHDHYICYHLGELKIVLFNA